MERNEFICKTSCGMTGLAVASILLAQGAGVQYRSFFPDYRLVVLFTEHNYGTLLARPLIIRNAIVPGLKQSYGNQYDTLGAR